MLLTDTGYQLVEHLERQRDAPALLASFQRLVLAFGMDGFCIGDPSHPDVKRENRRWGASFPVGWYWRYVSQNHLAHDPVVAQMNRSSAPFRWSDTHAKAGPRGRRVLDEAAQFGLRDGFAVPIHRHDGSVVGISISTSAYDLSPRDTLALQMASLSPCPHGRPAGPASGAAWPQPDPARARVLEMGRCRQNRLGNLADSQHLRADSTWLCAECADQAGRAHARTSCRAGAAFGAIAAMMAMLPQGMPKSLLPKRDTLVTALQRTLLSRRKVRAPRTLGGRTTKDERSGYAPSRPAARRKRA